MKRAVLAVSAAIVGGAFATPGIAGELVDEITLRGQHQSGRIWHEYLPRRNDYEQKRKHDQYQNQMQKAAHVIQPAPDPPKASQDDRLTTH